LSVLFQFMVITGIILAAIEGSHLAKSGQSEDYYTKANNMQKGGYVILLLAVILLAVYGLVLFIRLTKQRTHPAMKLLLCTIAAIVFTVVGVVYGLAAAVTGSPSLSPLTRTFAVKLVLIFIVQPLAALLFIVGGFLSRTLRHEGRRRGEVAVQLEHAKQKA
jgi:uncharacterized protein YacL